MTEFWENIFREKKEMWGYEPAVSTLITKDLFLENKVKNVLIPGIGYGRNAAIFMENGMQVTGIEISQTAIDLAKNHFGSDLVLYHGSVDDMPFDNKMYDGIYCYALIHLLAQNEREKLIKDCYNHLSEEGLMVFTTITKEASTYGQGKFIEKNRYEIFEGVKMFFYDEESIREEFGNAGLFEIVKVEDVYPFYLIKCRKVK